MYACMQAAFIYTIVVAVGLVCIHFLYSMIMSHMKVSVFLVCVIKLMLCPTIKYWLATPLTIGSLTGRTLVPYQPNMEFDRFFSYMFVNVPFPAYRFMMSAHTYQPNMEFDLFSRVCL